VKEKHHILTGNSASRYAEKLARNLGHFFDVTGYVKPDIGLEVTATQ